ncbi:MAG: GNAT family N-acetyltransferase [Pirellulales bacterium]|nr:GNAT family N-acetyltransferase [Pirellulales bacterium]
MDIHRISSWDDLASLQSAWNALADDIPFRRWEWLATWWKHYGGSGSRSQRLFVLAVYDDDPSTPPSGSASGWNARRLIGIAPWMLRHSPVVGTTIEYLGEEEVCSDHLTLLCEPGNSRKVTLALADYLATEFQDWEVLSLYGMDENDSLITDLFDALLEKGFDQPLHRHAFHTWRILLPDSWEEFFHRLSKSHRKHNKRAMQRVRQMGGFIVQNASTQDAFDAMWPALVSLHQKHWTSRNKAGCFASRRFYDFHREVAARMLDSGHVRLTTVEVHNRPISVEYSFMGSKATYAYLSGIDPDQMALEPGRLATIAAIQRAIEEGHATYDFLRGDEPYKPHWRAQPVQAWHIRVPNHHAIARLRNVSWRAKQWLKSKIAPIPPVSLNS